MLIVKNIVVSIKITNTITYSFIIKSSLVIIKNVIIVYMNFTFLYKIV